MTLKQLKWLTILVPPLLMGVFEFARRSFPWETPLPLWAGTLLAVGLVMAGTLVFSHIVFGIIERIARENERRRQEAEALFEVGTKITALLDSERVLQSVVEHARRLLTADVATIGLVPGEDDKTVRLVATSGITLEELEAMRTRRGHELPVEAAIHTGQPSFEEFPAAIAGEVRCRLAVPLVVGERVLGSLCVGSKAQRRFSHDETKLLIRLANQAAIAIENARLQAQAQQVATLEERERLSRELHDSLGQTLNYLALKMDIIGEQLESGHLVAAQAELERIREATRGAAADVRESILGLRTSISQEADWVTVLERYLGQYSELNGIATEMVVGEGARVSLPPASQVQLIRIIQEALANVRKHAAASKVWVRLLVEDGRLCAMVEDNGRGFAPAAMGRRVDPTFGLLVMRERARILGGELRVDSAPGRGTRVLVSVPLAADKESG